MRYVIMHKNDDYSRARKRIELINAILKMVLTILKIAVAAYVLVGVAFNYLRSSHANRCQMGDKVSPAVGLMGLCSNGRGRKEWKTDKGACAEKMGASCLFFPSSKRWSC